MGKDSRIEWTHHTFNPWWGCTKVSPACKYCYAEKWARRVGMDLWGARAGRRFFSDKHWAEPLRWNDEAASAGERRRVFCASMADVFEPRRELAPWRERLWDLIRTTPALDWLLLTKRPDYIADTVPWNRKWPLNVWIGTTAENQHWARRRVPQLLRYPAAVRFVSAEPLLGPVDLTQWFARGSNRVDWVIAGGESGAAARPMNPDWPIALRDQCKAHDVAFHFKQWGQWRPDFAQAPSGARRMRILGSGGVHTLVRLTKHAAGRILEDRTWDGLPARECT